MNIQAIQLNPSNLPESFRDNPPKQKKGYHLGSPFVWIKLN